MIIRDEILTVVRHSLCLDTDDARLLALRLCDVTDSIDRLELSFNLCERLDCRSEDVDACVLAPERTLAEMVDLVEAAVLRRWSATLTW